MCPTVCLMSFQAAEVAKKNASLTRQTEVEDTGKSSGLQGLHYACQSCPYYFFFNCAALLMPIHGNNYQKMPMGGQYV